MNKKKYKTYYVTNPKSNQHLVRLHQSQFINLKLDKSSYPNAKIHFSNSNLILESEYHSFESITYKIKPNSKYQDWSSFSNFFLGEIFVNSDLTFAKIAVVLKTQNVDKENFLTLVRPQNSEVKIKPGDILEVVLFENNFDEDSVWTWRFFPEFDCIPDILGQSSLKFKEFYSDATKKSENQANQLFVKIPRIIDSENFISQQEHFWFRFDKNLIKLLESNLGLQKLGEIFFYGSKKSVKNDYTLCSDATFNFSIYMDLNSQFKMRAFNSLLIPKIDQAQKTTNFSFSYMNLYANKTKKNVREIQVDLIETKCLEFGCKTQPANLQVEQKPKEEFNHKFYHKDYFNFLKNYNKSITNLSDEN